jgi:hypothetical protein
MESRGCASAQHIQTGCWNTTKALKVGVQAELVHVALETVHDTCA